MEKTKFCSYKNGDMARGCQLCVRGRKLVLFITGICPRNCYFCPLSDEKYQKDVIYANERPIEDLKEIIEESKLCSSQGCGITGGDPLSKFERTIEAIKLLKAEFKNYHIHLYTSLNLVDEDKLKQLEEAGLDEIRYHLDLEDDSLWEKVKIQTKMSKGIEIPVVPKINYEKIIDYVKDFVDFINLNELEYSDAECNKLEEKGFVTKDDYSYGILGSEELALELLEKYPKLNIHYCTCKLKDSIQLSNRIKLRAKNVKLDCDILNGETLIRGAIYGDDDLQTMQNNLSKHMKTIIDEKKNRLLCKRGDLKKKVKLIKKLGYKPVIVEDLATYDFLEIESQEI
jgi:uncharacterized protein